MSDQKEVLEIFNQCGAYEDEDSYGRPIVSIHHGNITDLIAALKEKDAKVIAGLVEELKRVKEICLLECGIGIVNENIISASQPTADKFMAEYAARVLNEATERIVMELEGLADDVAMTQVYRTGRQMVAEYCNPAGRTDGGAK